LIKMVRQLLILLSFLAPTKLSADCFNASNFENEPAAAVIVNTTPLIITAPISLALSAVGFTADAVIYSTTYFGPAVLFCLSLSVAIPGMDHSMGGQAMADCMRVMHNAELNHALFNAKGEFSSTIGKDIFEHTRDWRCPLPIIKN
jgi:hypothetical protein